MPWHGNSEYANPRHFRALSREERARWRFLTDTARARQRITAIAHDVAMALLQHHSQDGRCDPGHARLAQVARCSERAVQYALNSLKASGLVAWTRRIVRTVAGARQTSSAFRLLLGALATQRPRPDRKTCGGTKNMKLQRLTEAPRSDIDGAAAMVAELRPRQTLQEIRAAREAARTAFHTPTRSLADIRKQQLEALAAEARAKMAARFSR